VILAHRQYPLSWQKRTKDIITIKLSEVCQHCSPPDKSKCNTFCLPDNTFDNQIKSSFGSSNFQHVLKKID
jgi:hypothetical protein